MMKRTLILLFLGLVACSLRAEMDAPKISEAVPQSLYLEAGGRQVTAILLGNHLEALRKIEITRQGKAVGHIYTQIGPAAASRRTVSFIASPQCALGGDYQVRAVLTEGDPLSIPFLLTVVKAGDPKATLPDTASLAVSARVQTGNRMVVSESQAPVITGTVPSPLFVPPNGETQKIVIQGRNLKDITEVRVRKSDAPVRYRGSQGILPFRKLPEGIEVEVLAGTSTALNSQFVLDLMVKKYLAASVLMTVGQPPPQVTKESDANQPEPDVIPLIQNPSATP